MHLVIVRHGKAHPRSDSGLDRDRTLRRRGERQAAYVGQRLAEHDGAPRIVVSSPAARALETAQHIVEILDCRLEIDSRLDVDEPVSEALDVIAAGADLGSVCIVGHNPTLEELIGVLVAGPAGEPDRLRTGEAVRIELDPTNPIGHARVLERHRLEE